MLFLRRYSGLTIKYVRGADPVIKLLDDDESVIEVRNIFLSARTKLVALLHLTFQHNRQLSNFSHFF